MGADTPLLKGVEERLGSGGLHDHLFALTA